MIKGTGNPNNEAFSERVGVLYSLAYAIRMMPKQGIKPDEYFEYTVYPLEGVWDLTEKVRQSSTFDKDELVTHRSQKHILLFTKYKKYGIILKKIRIIY